MATPQGEVICGYLNDFRGRCILKMGEHPTDRKGVLIHRYEERQ